jgi:hypothetical protein
VGGGLSSPHPSFSFASWNSRRALVHALILMPEGTSWQCTP